MQIEHLKSIPPKNKIEGVPIKKVMAKYDVARTTVIRWRKHYGLTKCPTGEIKARLVSLIGQGVRCKDAMVITGCSSSYFWDINRTIKGRTAPEREAEQPFIPLATREERARKAAQERLGLTDDQMAAWMVGKVFDLNAGFVERICSVCSNRRRVGA